MFPNAHTGPREPGQHGGDPIPHLTHESKKQHPSKCHWFPRDKPILWINPVFSPRRCMEHTSTYPATPLFAQKGSYLIQTDDNHYSDLTSLQTLSQLSSSQQKIYTYFQMTNGNTGCTGHKKQHFCQMMIPHWQLLSYQLATSEM